MEDESSLEKILQEKWTNPWRKKFINYNGFILPENYLEFKDEIDSLPIYEDDVWICGFPRSGTNWTQEMVWMILNNLDYEGGKVILSHRVPLMETSVGWNVREIAEHRNMKPPLELDDGINFIRNQSRPRCIKTHFPWPLLPKEIRNGVKKPRIIYIARNPKDACVSFYYLQKSTKGFRGSFEEFCSLFLGGKYFYGPYWNSVLSFWNNRHKENVLFITYDEMKTDLYQMIVKVSQFLNRSLSEEQIKSLENHLSYESMKKKNVLKLDDFYLSLIYDGNEPHPASKDQVSLMGTGGRYIEMSTQLKKKFEEWAQRNTQGTDYNCWWLQKGIRGIV